MDIYNVNLVINNIRIDNVIIDIYIVILDYIRVLSIPSTLFKIQASLLVNNVQNILKTIRGLYLT